MAAAYVPKSYNDMASFRAAMQEVSIASRAELLNTVIYATIKNPGCGLADGPTLRSAAAMQEWGLLRGGHACSVCGTEFRLGTKGGRIAWIGPKGSHECVCWDTSASLSCDTDLAAGLRQEHFPCFLDFLGMWLIGFPRRVAFAEMRATGVSPKYVIEWQGRVQLEMAKGFHREHRARLPIGGLERVVECDETMVNRKKRSALNVAARPRPQRWAWGIVDHLNPARCYIKILPLPSDAIGGAPRCRAELERGLREAGLQPETIVVCDGWAAYDGIDWEGDFGCPPAERVNHSVGEIVNQHGFTTNHIESKWSSFKRWMRMKLGGVVAGPRKMEAYLAEYQWKQMTGGSIPAFVDTVRGNLAHQRAGGERLVLTDPASFGPAGRRYNSAAEVAQGGEVGEAVVGDDPSRSNDTDDDAMSVDWEQSGSVGEQDGAPGGEGAQPAGHISRDAARVRALQTAEKFRQRGKRAARRSVAGKKPSDVKNRAQRKAAERKRRKGTQAGRDSRNRQKRERRAALKAEKEAQIAGDHQPPQQG